MILRDLGRIAMSSAGSRYDSVVVGAGHNGLTCAAYLARGGRKVLVLEAAERLGGAAVTREFAPGFKASAGAHILHLMPPSLVRELGLLDQGLTLAAANLPTVALDTQGGHLSFAPDETSQVARASAADATALTEWRRLLKRVAHALHPVLSEAPPRLGTDAWRDRAALLGIGWRIRSFSGAMEHMRELLRIGGMCVYDLLEDRFTLPLLKGALALDAVLGTNYGPRSPGTVLSLLYRVAASQGADALTLPQGGLGAVSEALARVARAGGAEIRTTAVVERIPAREDRAVGVVLASGEEIIMRLTCDSQSADPKTTFSAALGAEHLDAGFVRRVAQLRTRGFLLQNCILRSIACPPFLALRPRRCGRGWW